MANEAAYFTAYGDVNLLLDSLQSGIRQALGEKLVGYYLYGSLVCGDFDHGLSDIDTLAAVSSPVTGEELERLREMHESWPARSRPGRTTSREECRDTVADPSATYPVARQFVLDMIGKIERIGKGRNR